MEELQDQQETPTELNEVKHNGTTLCCSVSQQEVWALDPETEAAANNNNYSRINENCTLYTSAGL